jgi:hypothetical protein
MTSPLRQSVRPAYLVALFMPALTLRQARSTPFGGVGDSGCRLPLAYLRMIAEGRIGGSYHGYDGFRTFSHFKSESTSRSAQYSTDSLPATADIALRLVTMFGSVQRAKKLTARSSEFLNAYRYPPMTAWAEKVVTFLLSSGVAFSRPTSVEHEASLRKQKRLRGLVLYVIGAGAVVLLGWAVRKRIMG